MAWWRLAVGGLAAVLAAVLATPGVGAQSRRLVRVAVGPIAGVHTGSVRTMLMSVLAAHPGEIELVSQSDTDAAMDRLGIRPSAEEGATVLGHDLLLDDVVVGSVEHRGRTWHFLVRVVRGSDGHSEGTASWDTNQAEDIPELHGEVWDEIHEYFHPDASRSGGHQGASIDAGNSPEAPSTGTGTPESITGFGHTTERSNHGDVASSERAPGVGWLWFSLGGGVSGRSWRLPVLGEPTPRGYDNPAYGEVQATLAAYYPFARGRMGIGVELHGALPLGLGSQGQNSSGMAVTLSSSAYDLYAGAALMLRPASGGSYKVGAGFMAQSFSIDTSQLPPVQQLADTSYVGLRVSGEAVMPLWSVPKWEFGLLFGGEFRLAQVGSAMRAAYGAFPTPTAGFGAEFGVAIRLDGAVPGLGLRAWAEFLRYRTGFTGTALVGTVSDSVDDYTRYVLAVTYSFGAARESGAPESTSTSTFLGSSSGSSDTPRREGDPFASGH